jgi:aminopeptidase
MTMAYTPPIEILKKYAEVFVGFALDGGKGIKKGDVVLVQVPECAKPIYAPLRDAILRSGGHPLMQFLADDVDEAGMYGLASTEQLGFFPSTFYRGLVDQIDHRISIIAESDKYELKDVDAKRILTKANSMKQYREWLNAKEATGKYSWTLGMYGTPAMAVDANMSEEDYWQQIIAACYLDEAQPIEYWRKTVAEIERVQSELNALSIKTLHVKAEEIDLTVGIGPNRTWLGGSGANIPSFEVFISPDWRATNGTIKFNQPLYRYGNIIENISLRFVDGSVVEATATKNQDLLREMIASENADKIGEFSLTDARLSRITKVMGETLFDENIGGPEGNTHLALGNAYQDSYVGDLAAVTKEQWDAWGYNQSPVHTDIVSTAPRTVTATMEDGSTRIIYSNGQFTL